MRALIWPRHVDVIEIPPHARLSQHALAALVATWALTGRTRAWVEKYLVLPPGYTRQIPAANFLAETADETRNFLFLRRLDCQRG